MSIFLIKHSIFRYIHVLYMMRIKNADTHNLINEQSNKPFEFGRRCLKRHFVIAYTG